jgi:DNA polymerase
MPNLFWDIEARSLVNLRDCGSYIYAIDPSTEPHCIAFAVDSNEPELWLPGNPPPPAFLEAGRMPKDWRSITHNNQFDHWMLEHVLVPRYGFLPIPVTSQHCTQRLALANAYPAELDLLAQALGLPYRKDPAARKAMLALSRPRPQRKRKRKTKSKLAPTSLFDEDPTKLRLLYERCKLDVVTCRAVWQSPKLKPLSTTERNYFLQDAAVNARGVRLDRAFTTAAKELAIRERTAINLRLDELTHGTISSVDQVKRFLDAVNARGHRATGMTKKSVAQILAGKPDAYVRELLTLRQAGARASTNKFGRMLAYASPADDRMRGTLRIYGAGPGRWAGLGPQLQNLKKNEANLPLSVVEAVRAGDRNELAKYGNPLAHLGDTSRAALCAGAGNELMSGDFSAVESVMLAYLAGETWKLLAYQEFQRSGDTTLEPYRVIARKMLRKPADAEIDADGRQLGKAADLACGFARAVGAWRRIVPRDLELTKRFTRSSCNGGLPIRPHANSGLISIVPSGSPFAPRKQSSWHRPHSHRSLQPSATEISP